MDSFYFPDHDCFPVTRAYSQKLKHRVKISVAQLLRFMKVTHVDNILDSMRMFEPHGRALRLDYLSQTTKRGRLKGADTIPNENVR